MSRKVGHKSVTRHNIPDELRNKFDTFTSISKHYQHLQTEKKLYSLFYDYDFYDYDFMTPDTAPSLFSAYGGV